MQAVESLLKDYAGQATPKNYACGATLKGYASRERRAERSGLGGAVGRGLTRLFGCWHMEMGRPLTQGAETYRACLGCGARRQFDAKKWEMTGQYYYPASKPGDLYAMTVSVARPLEQKARLWKLAA